MIHILKTSKNGPSSSAFVYGIHSPGAGPAERNSTIKISISTYGIFCYYYVPSLNTVAFAKLHSRTNEHNTTTIQTAPVGVGVGVGVGVVAEKCDFFFFSKTIGFHHIIGFHDSHCCCTLHSFAFLRCTVAKESMVYELRPDKSCSDCSQFFK